MVTNGAHLLVSWENKLAKQTTNKIMILDMTAFQSTLLHIVIIHNKSEVLIIIKQKSETCTETRRW